MSENDSSSSKHSAFAVATAVPWLPLHTTSTFPQHRLLWGQETVDYWSGSALAITKCSMSYQLFPGLEQGGQNTY